MESEFDHGLKESESDLLPSKKNSSSDEELHDSSMETYHQIGTPFISYKTGSKKNRILVENKSRSARRAQLREIDYINKLKLKINAEKAKLSLLPLQVFRDELIIFQMQKTNNALKKKVEALNKNKTDAQENSTRYYENCFLQSKENLNFGEGVIVQAKLGCNLNPKMNPMKMRRILINRRSTCRAKQQKLESMEELKKKIVQEKARVRTMHWEVCGHELEIMQLEEENHALEQQLEVLLNVKAQKQVEYQAMMKELDKYKLMYTRMNERK